MEKRVALPGCIIQGILIPENEEIRKAYHVHGMLLEYQNRLEKAYNVNKNTVENTQASESVVRDTDMAKTMVEYSNHNILLQAGQAIMAQVNNYNQGVLQLLQ